MGDSVWYIASPAPAPDDVAAQLACVREALVASGHLLAGDAPEAILGDPRGPVLRPGPTTCAAAQPFFATMLSNGAEFCETPIFNWGHLNTYVLKCKSCGVTFRSGKDQSHEENEAFADQLGLIGTAAGAADFGADAVQCLACEGATAVNDWVDGNGFILAGFGIGLWNWDVRRELTEPIKAAVERQMPQMVFVEDGYKI